MIGEVKAEEVVAAPGAPALDAVEEAKPDQAGEGKLPSDAELAARLRALLGEVDAEITSAKMLRKKLEDEFGVDLSGRKEFLRAKIDEFFAEQEGAGGEEAEAGGEGKKRKRKGKDNGTAKGGARKSGASLGSILSAELQAFVGEESMPRTQVVKKIWEYIREKNLQDPRDRRKIKPDAKLGTILPKTGVTMFSMNKFLSKHIFTNDVYRNDSEEDEEDELGEEAAAAAAAEEEEEEEEEEEKPRRKERKKNNGSDKTPVKAAKKEVVSKKAPKDAAAPAAKKNKFGGEAVLSPELAAVVGADRLPRTEVTRRIWAYIREHSLQDPKDKRRIVPDEKLGKVLPKALTMFKMTKELQRHMKTASEVCGLDESELEDESDGDDEESGEESE